MDFEIMEKMIDDIKIKRWQKWIDKIVLEVGFLIDNNYIFNNLYPVFEKKLRKDSLFLDTLRYNYKVSMIMGVCRQIDKDKDSESLINLLYEIFENSDLITKAWFVGRYHQRRVTGEKDFKKFGIDKIDPGKIYHDIGNIIYFTKNIKILRDKFFAHKDKNRNIKLLKLNFNDLDKAVAFIKEIVLKYDLLLNQNSKDPLQTVTDLDWKEILQVST